MSTDQSGAGGAPQGSGGTDETKENQDTKTDKVAYDTYRKAVDELKRSKERLAQFESQEKEKLEKDGKWEQLYQDLKAKLDEQTEKGRAKEAMFAYRTIASQFRAEAAKAGCQRVDALERLVDLKTLVPHLDESFNINQDALKSMIEKSQKEFDFLFGKPAPSFKDGTPQSKPQTKSYDDMSVAELEAVFKKL